MTTTVSEAASTTSQAASTGVVRGLGLLELRAVGFQTQRLVVSSLSSDCRVRVGLGEFLLGGVEREQPPLLEERRLRR
jgi:hypothetical protein